MPLIALEAFLMRWKSRIFSTEDDIVWKEWVDHIHSEKNCNVRDELKSLVTGDVRDSLKMRALLVLLAPDPGWLPLYWIRLKDERWYVTRVTEIKGLSPALLDFVADTVCEFQGQLASMDEEGREEHFEVFETYSNMILNMIPRVDEERAQKLLDAYDLNDPSPFYNMDDASGYRPFLFLMMNGEIDERWKRGAVARMQERILDELNGRAVPRRDYENALACYQRSLTFSFIRSEDGKKEVLRYSEKLFRDQLTFILSLPDIESRLTTLTWDASRYLPYISERSHRHIFARAFVRKNENGFTAHGSNLGIAKELLKEFGEEDPELAAIMIPAIQAGEEDAKISCANQDAKRRKQEQYKSILHRMK